MQSYGVARSGLPVILLQVVVVRLFLLFENTLNNSRHLIKVNRASLHPRPEERGFTLWGINTPLYRHIKR